MRSNMITPILPAGEGNNTKTTTPRNLSRKLHFSFVSMVTILAAVINLMVTRELSFDVETCIAVGTLPSLLWFMEGTLVAFPGLLATKFKIARRTKYLIRFSIIRTGYANRRRGAWVF